MPDYHYKHIMFSSSCLRIFPSFHFLYLINKLFVLIDYLQPLCYHKHTCYSTQCYSIWLSKYIQKQKWISYFSFSNYPSSQPCIIYQQSVIQTVEGEKQRCTAAGSFISGWISFVWKLKASISGIDWCDESPTAMTVIVFRRSLRGKHMGTQGHIVEKGSS